MSLQLDKVPVSSEGDQPASKEVATKEDSSPAPPPSVHNAALAVKKKSTQPKKPKPKKLVTFEECLSEVIMSSVWD